MKVYQFLYCSDTWESSSYTESIHLTKDGAEKAMNDHKEQKRKEWQKTADDFDEAGRDIYLANTPFGENEYWGIVETEVLP